MTGAAAVAVSSTSDPIQSVRRFNRFYTRQIGVVQQHLLDSPFSLTEVRVLYELAHRSNLAAVELAEELGLDRGYLSRMLKRFTRHGWISTSASPSDKRRLLLSLTPKGMKVFAPLDRKSSEEVATMLQRISPSQQKNLIAAMQSIESLLSPSAVPRLGYSIRQHRPGDMGWIVHRHGVLYWQEYRYDERFEALVAKIVAEFVERLDPDRERCWLAEVNGEIVGSVFLVKKSQAVAKLRLLLVEPSARGMGIGKRLVEECIDFARSAGYRKIVLWTQSELLAARHLYKEAGFRLIAEKPHQSWGRDDLIAETWELALTSAAHKR